jgi:hypothetical protein
VILITAGCSAGIYCTCNLTGSQPWMIWLTRLILLSFDSALQYVGRVETGDIRTAQLGEVEAYFYLWSLGYRIVAKNFRAAFDHGEIDLVGWDDDVLCFIEFVATACSEALHLGRLKPRKTTNLGFPEGAGV